MVGDKLGAAVPVARTFPLLITLNIPTHNPSGPGPRQPCLQLTQEVAGPLTSNRTHDYHNQWPPAQPWALQTWMQQDAQQMGWLTKTLWLGWPEGSRTRNHIEGDSQPISVVRKGL